MFYFCNILIVLLYSFKMDEILELHPDEQELNQFQFDIIRPLHTIFNPLGMYCPVPECSRTVKYFNVRDLNRHWKHIHQEYNEVFKCTICRKKIEFASRVKQHVCCVHDSKGDDAGEYYIKCQLKNKIFIPLEICCVQ